jgi:DNA-binding MarR family transcriptional regulator
MTSATSPLVNQAGHAHNMQTMTPTPIFDKQANHACVPQAPPTRFQHAQISAVAALLQAFRDIDRDMPSQIALTFTLIMENPGITQAELVKLGQMGTAAVNRHVTVLGPYNKRLKQGHGLISADVDPNDRRRKLLHLTTEGQMFSNGLVNIMNKAHAPRLLPPDRMAGHAESAV